MEGTWPSGARTIDRRYRIWAVRTFFFLHPAISSPALSAEDPRVPSEVLATRTVLVLQWTHTSVRAPFGQVPSTLRHLRDKFYQAPSFSCVQHWKIERSLGTRLIMYHTLSSSCIVVESLHCTTKCQTTYHLYRRIPPCLPLQVLHLKVAAFTLCMYTQYYCFVAVQNLKMSEQ